MRAAVLFRRDIRSLSPLVDGVPWFVRSMTQRDYCRRLSIVTSRRLMLVRVVHWASARPRVCAVRRRSATHTHPWLVSVRVKHWGGRCRGNRLRRSLNTHAHRRLVRTCRRPRYYKDFSPVIRTTSSAERKMTTAPKKGISRLNRAVWSRTGRLGSWRNDFFDALQYYFISHTIFNPAG